MTNSNGGYSLCNVGALLYYNELYGDICYWILSLYASRNAEDSKTACMDQNGDLAFIPDQFALDIVMTLLFANDANVSGWYAYLGYRRVNASTTFLAIDGTSLLQTWIPWDTLMGQPLQSSLQCIAINGATGLWHDMHCSNNIKAICSTPLSTANTTTANQEPTNTTTTTQEPTTTTTTTQEPTTTTTTTQEPITTTTTTTQEPTTTTTTTQEPITTTTTTTQEPTTTTTTTQEPITTTTTTTQEPITTTTTTTQEPKTTTTTTQEPTTTTTTTQEPTTTTTTTQEPTTTTTTTQEPTTTTTTTQEPTTTTTTTQEPTTTTTTTQEPITTTTTTTQEPTTTTTTTQEPTTTTTTTQELTTSTTSSLEQKTTEHQTTNIGMCWCPCHYTIFGNISDELQVKLDILREQTKVDEETLSSTIRKRTCANDPRPSAAHVGYGGIAMLSVVFGGIVLPDLFPALQTLYNIAENIVQHCFKIQSHK
ncbi:mucin-2-like [Ylistrum balloti]|uniref:mucin-2-like n=1 Tax=Ylistrum balloti TaxID=509963 RepID=UPI002905859D|nr:mucin-2-like [Ylistrum balloti]